MITATATGADGKRMVILGLSFENLKRLHAGTLIRVDADSHAGFPVDLTIAIFAGETERTMTEQIRPLISPDTKVIAVPKDKGSPS